MVSALKHATPKTGHTMGDTDIRLKEGRERWSWEHLISTVWLGRISVITLCISFIIPSLFHPQPKRVLQKSRIAYSQLSEWDKSLNTVT